MTYQSCRWLNLRYTEEVIVDFVEECSALDPRFKGLPWLSAEKCDAVYSRILRAVTVTIDKETEANSAETSETVPDATIIVDAE